MILVQPSKLTFLIFLNHKIAFYPWISQVTTWPSRNLPFDCQKIAQNLPFFQKKIGKNCHFFLKNCQWKKKTIFANFFWKNGKFWAIFWQSNGKFLEGQVTTHLSMIITDVRFGLEFGTNLSLFKISFQYILTQWA